MARTRGNGEGSVFMSATRGWCASITDLDGRRITRKAPIQTKAGAEKLLRQLLRERDEGAVARRSTTVERYLPEWLDAVRLRGCRPRTLEAYEEKMRVHVLPTLGKVRFDRLMPSQVEQLYAAKLKAGLSANSVSQIHQILGNLLKCAKRRGLITRNVLEMVDPPKVPKFHPRPLTAEEASRLLRAVRGHRYGPMCSFLVATGTRFGEAAGLCWDRLDLDAATAIIDRAAVRVRENGRSRLELSPTKSAAGNRTVPLLPWMVELLRQQRVRVAELRLAAGPVWHDQNLVFPSSVGTPLREAHVNAAWHKMLTDSGLPNEARMHDLRHTFATVLLDNGEDVVAVQRTLGHSRVGMTADLYTGRIPTAQRRAVDRFGELLAEAAAP